MKVTLVLAVIVSTICTAYAASVLAKRLGLVGIRAETLRRVCVGMSGVAAGFVLLAVALAIGADNSRGTVLTFAALLIAFGGRDMVWPLLRSRKDAPAEGELAGDRSPED
ncbi:MAG: hypothetical protein M3Q27_17290 [Actinomycetota bacterium]|nr:hypothetical protein [Actinomycetota bacterium]